LTICAIMQPTYLPWAGFFALMREADVFVYLDDVQYARKTWQCQNRILVNGCEKMLRVPVAKQPLQESIHNILVDPKCAWQEEHKALLEEAYGHSAYGPEVLPVLFDIFDRKQEKLSEINIAAINAIGELLGIKTQLYKASDLACGESRSDHVALICETLGATKYLSPVGAKAYLEQDDFSRKYGIELSYQKYTPGHYEQPKCSEFVSHLSIVDVISNIGVEQTKAYIAG
jgi:hypothetical protein